MDEMKRIYRLALPSHIAELEAALALDPDDAAAKIRRLAHALRGSGGTYGFPDVTVAAAAVEDAAPHDVQPRTASLIAVLREHAMPDDEQGRG
jgi:HPt (histidine-containing phosphotransfer) domain-containing protein